MRRLFGCELWGNEPDMTSGNGYKEDAPLIGHVDRCILRGNTNGGVFIEISGWIAHVASPVSELRFGLHPKNMIDAIRIQRLDVARQLSLPHADNTGYTVSIQAPDLFIPEIVPIFCSATLSDGQILTTIFQVRPDSSALTGGGDEYTENAQTGGSARLQAATWRSLERISNGKIPVPSSNDAEIGVVWVLRSGNEAACHSLYGLLSNFGHPMRLMVSDCICNEESRALTGRIEGALVVSGDIQGPVSGSPFMKGCKFLLFTSSDVTIMPSAITHARRILENDSGVGAVTGVCVSPDFKTSEVMGYCFDTQPELRDVFSTSPASDTPAAVPVDFGSSDFLLIRLASCGIGPEPDRSFVTNLYRDIDFAIRLAKSGLTSVACPSAFVLSTAPRPHFYFSSPGRLRDQDREKLFLTHPEHREGSRDRPDFPKVLIIDDFIPSAERGQGLPRAGAIAQRLVEKGSSVTLLAVNETEEFARNMPAVTPMPGLDVVAHRNRPDAVPFVVNHLQDFDLVWVSRPDNLRFLFEASATAIRPLGTLRIVYDAEAIFAHRRIIEAEVLHSGAGKEADYSRMVAKELECCSIADIIITVSDKERRDLQKHSNKPVFRLGYSGNIAPGPASFEDRFGFLFLGPVLQSGTPNHDALEWFLQKVYPGIASSIPSGPVLFSHVGFISPDCSKGLSLPRTHMCGVVSDLAPVFNRHRVFVAPMRFSAGIPLKIIQAACLGLPTVCTPLAAEQLGWSDGKDLLVAGTAQEFHDCCCQLHADRDLWSRIREGALARVAEQYSEETFAEQFDKVLRELGF